MQVKQWLGRECTQHLKKDFVTYKSSYKTLKQDHLNKFIKKKKDHLNKS